MLSARYKLRDKRQIARLMNQRRAQHGDLLIAKAAPSPADHSRLAVVVSTKFDKRAVRRNLIRRRIFAAAAAHLDLLSSPTDCVLIFRSAASLDRATYDNIQQDLLKLFSTPLC